jgi:hypothetical protein
MREETKIKIQLARIIRDKMSSSYKRIVEFYQDDIQVMNWLIEQAKKAERYEKALKEIAEWSGIASREYRIAKKALEGEE